MRDPAAAADLAQRTLDDEWAALGAADDAAAFDGVVDVLLMKVSRRLS